MHKPIIACALCLFVVIAPAQAASQQAAHRQVPSKPALAEELAAKPLALVVGNRCHIKGAVWIYGPRANVDVELLDGTRSWRTRTNAQGFYSLSIPYPGHDVALIERPVDVRVRTREQTPVHLGKPALLCSQRLTNQLLTQRKP